MGRDRRIRDRAVPIQAGVDAGTSARPPQGTCGIVPESQGIEEPSEAVQALASDLNSRLVPRQEIDGEAQVDQAKHYGKKTNGLKDPSRSESRQRKQPSDEVKETSQTKQPGEKETDANSVHTAILIKRKEIDEDRQYALKGYCETEEAWENWRNNYRQLLYQH